MVRLAQNRPGGSLPLSLIRSGQNVGDGQNPISTGVRAKTWIFDVNRFAQYSMGEFMLFKRKDLRVHDKVKWRGKKNKA
jgi:hypothetical protein